MFERLRKAFSSAAPSAPQTVAAATSRLSEWAGTQGLGYSSKPGTGFMLEGKIAGRPWRMECGKPSRDFIRGEELRARAEMGVRDDAAVLVMNRPLKDALEKRAYAMFTDSLQTIADPHLPEEMRWLSMYDEVGWESAPPDFWKYYSVLADRKEDASAWLSDRLVRSLLAWPLPNPETPFVLMVLRGKLYLRMEYAKPDTPTLEHAVKVFTLACEDANAGLTTDLSI